MPYHPVLPALLALFAVASAPAVNGRSKSPSTLKMVVESKRPTAVSAPVAPKRWRSVAGSISGRTRWTRDVTYQLRGDIEVSDGAELTIDAGTRIEAAPGARIFVARTGRINAIGTLYEPIVLACALPTAEAYAGCWGGLVIQGNAPINIGQSTSPASRGSGAAGCRESVSAVTGLLFGGCDAADSSGTLRYVRIENAQHDGLRLEGVGSRTIIDFVQVNRGLSTGINVIGGTVNLSHIMLTANGGTALAWNSGWTGKGQYMMLHLDHLRGISGHGGIVGSNGSGAEQNALPRSAPQLWNISILAASAVPITTMPPAVQFSRGTAGTLHNVFVSQPFVGVSIKDDATCAQMASGALHLRSSVISGATSIGDPDPDPAGCSSYASPSVEASWFADASNGNTSITDPGTVQAIVSGVNELELLDGRLTQLFTGATPPSDGFFRSEGTYIGGTPPRSVPASMAIPWHSGWSVPAYVPPPTPSGTIAGLIASAQRSLPAGLTISANNFLTSVVSGAGGAFSLSAAAGPATLAVNGLPGDCRIPDGTDAFVPAGATVNATLLAVCGATGSTVELMAALEHTCALSAEGAPRCWGHNIYGQVGDGTRIDRASAVPLAGTATFATLINANLYHSCGLTAVGAAWCWGYNNNGQLGDGTLGSAYTRATPAPVVGGLAFRTLAAGGYQTCGLTGAGKAYCWGENTGNGTTDYFATPQPVASTLTFVQISSGLAHTCALTDAGSVYCWGGNGVGQLGDGTFIRRNSPTAISGGLTFASISAGREHTCAVTGAGAAYCWGMNVYGQVGDGNTNLVHVVPIGVAGAHTFAAVDAGTYHTCGLTTDGSAYCWGANFSGQIGDGTLDDRGVPTLVGGGRQYRSISAGGAHSCALAVSASAFCWGSNLYGQLGLPAGSDEPLPIAVPLP